MAPSGLYGLLRVSMGPLYAAFRFPASTFSRDGRTDPTHARFISSAVAEGRAVEHQCAYAAISGALPPGEEILLLDWIRQGDISPYDKRIATYFMAHFAETSGKRDEALRLFSDLAYTAPGPQEDVARLSQAAVSRLQK